MVLVASLGVIALGWVVIPFSRVENSYKKRPDEFKYSLQDAGEIMETFIKRSDLGFRPAYIYIKSDSGYLFGPVQNGGPSYNFVPAGRCFEVNGNTGVVSRINNKDSIKVRRFAYFLNGRFVERS